MPPSGHGRRFHAARTNVSAHLAVELVALLPLLAGERVALRVAPQAPVECVLEGLDVVDEDVLVAADEGAEELAEPVQLVQALKLKRGKDDSRLISEELLKNQHPILHPSRYMLFMHMI